MCTRSRLRAGRSPCDTLGIPTSSGSFSSCLGRSMCASRRSLATLGYSQSDVDTAIVSHLHEDHIGGMAVLGDADLWVSTAELGGAVESRPGAARFPPQAHRDPGIELAPDSASNQRRTGPLPPSPSRWTSWGTARWCCCPLPVIGPLDVPSRPAWGAAPAVAGRGSHLWRRNPRMPSGSGHRQTARSRRGHGRYSDGKCSGRSSATHSRRRGRCWA